LICAAIRTKALAMSARIYQPPKNAMQSGKALADQWILEFAPAEARRADPLMGWTGSGDTQVQVVLKFATCAEAQAYAEKYGITATVHSVPPRRLKLQAYADNFR
jgi:ETC complex I subunit conserved region